MMKTTYQVTCKTCEEKHYILANPKDVDAWLNGDKTMEDALPYLTPDEMELFTSRICNNCWIDLFGNAADKIKAVTR